MKNRILHIILFLVIILTSIHGKSQSILFNDGGGSPDSSAILDVRSDDSGLLIPRMISANRISIASPAKGLLVYQTNGVQGFYYYDGVQWDTLDGNSVVNTVTSVSNTKIAIISDLKPSGTDGGSFLSGSWDTRDLNLLQGDSSFVSIDGISKFTLDSGLYEVSVIAPARSVDVHQIRLYNVDSSSTVGLGTAVNSAAASTSSELYIVFKIENRTIFEVQHRCTGGSANIRAKGWAIPWGDCVYTVVRIQQFN